CRRLRPERVVLRAATTRGRLDRGMRVFAVVALASIVAPTALVGCLQLVGVSDWEGPQGAGGRDAGQDAAALDADAAHADADGEAGQPDYADLVQSDRPVAYYRFEEMSPPTAHDAVGDVHDGIYHGTLSGLGADGIAGSFGVELDGTDDYVEI